MKTRPASNDVRQLVLRALRSPRGRYEATRASQLSGIPASTLYEWNRSRVWRPEFLASSPMEWSYRDLVFVRILAWLRQHDMDRNYASEIVAKIRDDLTSGREIDLLRSDGLVVLIGDETTNRFDGQDPLPLDELIRLMSVFDVVQPINELGVHRLWGPNLIEPSEHTYISPWVMAGEPCIEETRIPSATVFALKELRGLETTQIAALYPGVASDRINDAWVLERRLRRLDEAA